jgi:hypothetical protein
MSSAIGAALQKGATMKDLLNKLQAVSVEGKKLTFSQEERCTPYLTDKVVEWTDGPPTSVVAFVLSGADVDGEHWRRWTISKVGPWRYQLGCFPTPYNNARDPLAPGVPPTSSRRG